MKMIMMKQYYYHYCCYYYEYYFLLCVLHLSREGWLLLWTGCRIEISE